METIKVKLKKIVEDAVIPSYAHDGDMGMDLTAVSVEYDAEKDCYIYHTGLSVEIPKGYGMLLFPRSSNRRTNAYMTNHVGVIDSCYRGEILVCFKNRTSSLMINIINKIAFAVNSILGRIGMKNLQVPLNTKELEFPYHIGDRIAQVVIIPYPIVEYVETEKLSETKRGKGGHGSTGK